MTIPNDDSKPDQPAADGAVPAPDAAGSLPPAAPQPPAAPSSDLPPVPSAPAAAEAPAFPAYSAVPAAPVAAPTTPPSQVNTAFWLYIAAAVLSVISSVITVIIVSNSRDSLLNSLNGSSSRNNVDPKTFVDAAIGFGITWAIVTVIFWVAVFVVFAVFMRRGANWARIALTVVTAISLLNIGAGYFAGLIQIIVAIIATILIWLKPASAYFAAVKASKAPRA